MSSCENDTTTFQYFKPGFDLSEERRLREEAGQGELITEDDLYPDVRPAFTALRAAGYRVALAGNQTDRAAELLRSLSLPVDAIATSGEWGVAKPDARFFDDVVELARLQARRDRLRRRPPRQRHRALLVWLDSERR